MNNLSRFTATVALAGFLFGFDTVVISGANLPLRELWDTTAQFHGLFIMSMALWGTVIGAVFGGWPCDKIGRKNTLILIGILYTVSALGSALAHDPYLFSFFRLIGGIGVGASSVAAPIYLSEISPPERRGSLVARYQFMIVFGIFIAYFSNYLLKGVGGANDWRYMLGIEAVPAVIYTLMVLGVPNSPRWLVLHRNDGAGAARILTQLGIQNVEAAITAIRNSVQHDAGVRFFDKRHSRPILLAFLIAFFNQLSGINFILYYAPQILEMAGLAAQESLLNSILIGFTNLIFTYVGLYLIDKLGRRQLLLIGSIGYIISLGMVAFAFYTGAGPVLLLTFILLFIASHAVGQGAVIWVFISEIFPTAARASGQSWGTGVHWVFAAIITLVGPIMIDLFAINPWPIFAFFAAFMVLQLLFVLFLMPETKGKSLEDVGSEISG